MLGIISLFEFHKKEKSTTRFKSHVTSRKVMGYTIKKHDVLIVGGSLAGLTAGRILAQKFDVMILTKAHPLRSPAMHDTTGINAVMQSQDSIQSYLHDMIEAGDFPNDQSAAEVL